MPNKTHLRPIAMDDTAFVAGLYRTVLRREPDELGLAHWIRTIETTGDYTLVLAAMLASPEYNALSCGGATPSRRLPTTPPEVRQVPAAAAILAGGLARAVTIVDVGAQTLDDEAHVYEALRQCGLSYRIIGFEPLSDRLGDRERHEDDASMTLYPFAIGDGGSHTLHVNNIDATSSLLPLNDKFNAAFLHLAMLHTVERRPIDTQRLDDVLPADTPVDFLKLDVQGFELAVLTGAAATLARTAVVHVEVEFAPIYQGQPLFGAIHDELVARGFYFVDFVSPGRLPYATKGGRHDPDRLLWADAVFFRDSEFLRHADGGQSDLLLAQALIALLVYRKPTMAEFLLERHDIDNGTDFARVLREI